MFKKIKEKYWGEELLMTFVCLFGMLCFLALCVHHNSQYEAIISEATEKYSCSDVGFEYNEDANADMPLGYVIVCKTYDDDYRLNIEYNFDKKGKEWYTKTTLHDCMRHITGILAIIAGGCSVYFVYLAIHGYIFITKLNKSKEDKTEKIPDPITRF